MEMKENEFWEYINPILENKEFQKRKEYISDLISESKENATTSKKFSHEILEYANTKIIPDSSLRICSE